LFKEIKKRGCKAWIIDIPEDADVQDMSESEVQNAMRNKKRII
jgi:hypothetical protein